jgi:subtilase family serine protease
MSLNILHFLRRRPFLASLVALVALLGLGVTAASSGTAAGAAVAGPPTPLVASVAQLPAGAARIGTVSPDTTMTVTVTLAIPDQAALTAFLDGLADPSSPNYQHYLAPGQFGSMFGPSLSEVDAVDSALRAAGLSPGPVSSDRLSIPVTATASAIEHAFGVTLDRFRLAGGRIGFANTAAPKLPASVAAIVGGVLGLNDLYPEQHESDLSSASVNPALIRSLAEPRVTKPGAAVTSSPTVNPGPQPCSAISDELSGATADVIAAHYGLAQRYEEGDYGSGAKIAIAELEPNLKSDITGYEQCYGITTKVNYLKIDGGSGSGAGQGEAALDIEMVAGLAPKSTVDVYQAPNTGTGFYDIFRKWVTSDTEKVMSVSWGACEAETDPATAKAQETLFEQANAQGQTVFAAAGDFGSTSCSNNSTPNPKVNALSPASEPYVIGVGGTTVANNAEEVWNDSAAGFGAGGGGVSSAWCMPSYQHKTAIPGLISKYSKKDTKSCASGYFRETPDIDALGDPEIGYAVAWNNQWEPIGGTSAATPVWAAIAALTEDSAFCSAYKSKGAFSPQNLYATVSTYRSYIYASSPQGLYDVKIGNNDYTPSGYSGGLYPATKGYDMASGLGSPMLSGLHGVYDSGNGLWDTYLTGLTQLLCHNSATTLKTVKVTSVSPSSGKAGKAAKLVVHGSGFLPIAGADKAQIITGSKITATVNASCSTTACTITVPAESARTVDIRIRANSVWGSALSTKDRYKY